MSNTLDRPYRIAVSPGVSGSLHEPPLFLTSLSRPRPFRQFESATNTLFNVKAILCSWYDLLFLDSPAKCGRLIGIIDYPIGSGP